MESITDLEELITGVSFQTGEIHAVRKDVKPNLDPLPEGTDDVSITANFTLTDTGLRVEMRLLIDNEDARFEVLESGTWYLDLPKEKFEQLRYQAVDSFSREIALPRTLMAAFTEVNNFARKIDLPPRIFDYTLDQSLRRAQISKKESTDPAAKPRPHKA